MSLIDSLINTYSNQNLSLFFESKITSFKPERDVFYNIVKEESSFSDPIKIGHADLFNHEELLVFSCEYQGTLTERSAKKQQFTIAKKVLKEDFKDGAIFVFYDKEGNFRFSFIRRNYGESGEKKYSTWKRYTYYVNTSETNRTFKERLNGCSYESLDNIQEAFSVEKLTKQFYNELFAWYQWTLSEDVGITFPNNTKTSDDDRIQLEEQVIRLITRMLFVWFIKQKKLIPQYFFDNQELSEILKEFNSHSTEDGNYYNAILQNLFFATLNKEIEEREFAKTKNRDIKTRYRYEEMFNLNEEEIIDLFKPVPFLNGGLFECLDKQDVEGNQYFLDGFSRNPTKSANGNFRHRAFIPNCVFFDEEKGIIPLLKRYNFTVEENAPNEVQVALDPELLGEVFENLLGAFNPETKDTARQQSGSFYTPREIVNYMVDESLISYIKAKLPSLDEKLIRKLFEEEKIPEKLSSNNELSQSIAQQLKAIKILDPACGSGAFPMGILNKMVTILEKLGNRQESIHDLKLHLIEECIYGIDIQPIAIQISKLRFFISLVVEQETIDLNKPEENYGVLTLPNLETKFVAANTLIGIKKKKAGDFHNTLFTDTEIEDTKKQLLEIRHEHFYAKTAGAKKRLREQDAILRDRLSKLLQENKEFAPEDAIQLSQWNPYDQNTSSSFFDIEWMFGLHKGFDIVIGNPPYIDSERMVNLGMSLLRDELKILFNSLRGNWDIYVAFFDFGFSVLNRDGLLSYITPDKWLNKSFGKELRRNHFEKLIKIARTGRDVFKSVGVDSIVTLFQNSVNTEINVVYYSGSFNDGAILKKNILEDPYQLDIIFSQHLDLIMRITNEFNDTINHLGFVCENACSTSETYELKKYLKNDFYDNQKYKVINTGTIGKFKSKWGLKEMTYLKDKYLKPVVEKETFKKNMSKTYVKKTTLRKLIIKGMTLLDVMFDEIGSYIPGKSTLIIYAEENQTGLEGYLSLMCFLNSKFPLFYLKERYSASSYNGGITFNKDMFNRLPIPSNISNLKNISLEIYQKIKEGKDVKKELEIVNTIVYKLFKLKYFEVLIVDPEFKLTQEEYENYKIES